MPLVLDLCITHERVGRSSDLSLNGNLRYPNDNDRSLNEVATDKILKYRGDYNNNPRVAVRETDRFFAASGVQPVQHNSGGLFTFKHVSFSTQRKTKVGITPAKTVSLLLILT